jgi:hypothetical protein
VSTHSPPTVAIVVGLPNYDHPNFYTVAFKDRSISEYKKDLLSAALVLVSMINSSFYYQNGS